MTTSTSDGVSAMLWAAAFGDDAGRWPLPAAGTSGQRWLRAVAAGGQGYYAVAQAELAVLRRTERTGSLASLACSTRGSLLRQLGRHQQARGWDGRALAVAGADVEARQDALVGLAADALGMGRFAASRVLLERAEAELSAAHRPVDRLAVRLQWVSAELAMITGDGETAVEHAHRGVDFAHLPGGSARHRAKSNVVLAAALCSSGSLDRARAIADAGLDTTRQLGLIPLRWALASLLEGIGSRSHELLEVRTIKASAADEVRRRGGIWSNG